jgi:hypothetical protein
MVKTSISRYFQLELNIQKSLFTSAHIFNIQNQTRFGNTSDFGKVFKMEESQISIPRIIVKIIKNSISRPVHWLQVDSGPVNIYRL